MSTVTDLESYQQYAQEQQAANNAWSAEQAQKQMDFQERMSSTAHQREVADLKAAGLNPVLSANSGAAVPNGASGDTDTSASGNVGAILQQVLQAQSAREVAGMYNAATMAAAQMAAQASMYGADLAYKNTEDHPNTFESVLARLFKGLVGGNSSGSGSLGSFATGALGLLGLSKGHGGSMFSGLRGLAGVLAGLGAGNFIKDAAEKLPVSPDTPQAALVGAGLLGNANAARQAGANWAAKQYPLDPNKELWKSQVLPALKKLGYDTGNNNLMRMLYNHWINDYDGFMKKYINRNRLSANIRRAGIMSAWNW